MKSKYRNTIENVERCNIYIILPVHNRKEITKGFLECLKEQSYKNFTLILIDDGSTDGTKELLDDYYFKSVLIHGDGNLYWGGGLHEGYKYIQKVYNKNIISGNDIVLICNDDIFFDNRLLESIVLELDTSGNNSIIHSTVYDKKTKNIVHNGIKYDFKKMSFKAAKSYEEINCLPTRCLFMRASAFVNVNGYKQKSIRHYLSDYYLTLSFYKEGYSLVQSIRVIVYLDCSTTKNIKKNFNATFRRKYYDVKSPKYIISRLSFAFFISKGIYKVLLPVKVLKEALVDFLRYLFRDRI